MTPSTSMLKKDRFSFRDQVEYPGGAVEEGSGDARGGSTATILSRFKLGRVPLEQVALPKRPLLIIDIRAITAARVSHCRMVQHPASLNAST